MNEIAIFLLIGAAAMLASVGVVGIVEVRRKVRLLDRDGDT